MADLPRLTPADFDAWFDALWGHRPFPWQQELVDQVHSERRWPALVDLPTGTGKTSLIDIAVFMQALDAEHDPTERWMPRRIVSVVDRRIVVDQAADRAKGIAQALTAEAPPTIVATVAKRLRHLAGLNPPDDEAGTDPPLLVATLRGAIARDESWMRRPDVPAVISSTVDQAGSRLLFRGYGISRGMRPIHAGLLGNDVLWLLDEVHLARPFAQTLHQVGDLRAWRRGDTNLPDRWSVVEMSATPSGGGDDGDRFPAQAIDPESHPVIGRRLRASKPAVLEAVKVASDRAKADATFAAACADHARRLVNAGTGTVAVIVNRVDTARRVYRLLEAVGPDAHLLTGRMRPVDRDRTVRNLWPRLKTGRARSTIETPLILVATQCIEVGADFDLDAIVTEVASLDALTQRFGRVDRDGQLSEVGQQTTNVVLARSTDITSDAEDPVYGKALRETWAWLTGKDSVDFGIQRLRRPEDPAALALLVADQGTAPHLLPTHLDQLCQTSVAVSGEPEVSRWLHGDARPSPDVQIVWRADIDETLLRSEYASIGAGLPSTALSERLGACPPASTEALTLSIGAARQWLAGDPTIEVSDAEGVDVSGQDAPERKGRPWIRWAAGRAVVQADLEADESRPVARARLRPGDVIVVPAAYGGLTASTWDPTAAEPVVDVATEALHRQGRLDVLRLVPPLAPPLVDETDVDLPTADDLDTRTRSEQRALIDDVLEAIDGQQLDEVTREVVASLRRARSSRRVIAPPGAAWASDPQGTSLIVSCPAPRLRETSILTGPIADTDATDDASSFSSAPQGDLDQHLAGVRDWARHLALHLGLDAEMAHDLATAGHLHDEGKRDPRFQLWLHEGDEVARATLGRDLAKSRRREPSGPRRRELQRRSGYPRHARHELTSLPLVEGRLDEAHDRDLVAHLVASHHGWCRPFAPPLVDRHPVPIGPDGISSDHGMHRIDAGPPDRFWQLNQRYGWFQLAWLETILRLGDHRRSEVEQRETGGPR